MIMNLQQAIPPPWRSLRSSLRTWASAFVLLLATTWIAAAQGTAPPANTSIGNRATATYTDGGGTERSVTSNAVTTIVQQVAGLKLEASQTKPGAAGVSVSFAHTLTNTGNGPDTFDLETTDTGSAFGTGGLLIYADLNDDGIPDDLTPITSTPQIPAGGTFKFVILANVPASGLTDGASLPFDITATSQHTTAITDENTDTVEVNLTKALLEVTKSITPNSGPSPSGGEPIVVTLRYQNKGLNDAAQITLTDDLPTGMLYVPGSAKWSETSTDALVDNTPTTATSGNTIEVKPVTGNGEVSFDIASVKKGNSGYVTFEVTIDSGLSAQVLLNDIDFSYYSGTDTTDEITGTSNVVQYTVTGKPGVEIVYEPEDPTETPEIPQGGTVAFKNRITNTGNLPDAFDVTIDGSTFPAGTAFALFKSDGQTPLEDTNGNGIPDTGMIQPGADYIVVLKATVPPNATGTGFTVKKKATSVTDPNESEETTDGPVDIVPSQVDLTNNAAKGAPGALGEGPDDGLVQVSETANPGETVVFNLFATNGGLVTDTYDIRTVKVEDSSSTTLPPWSIVFKRGSTNITNTGEIRAGENGGFTANVVVPANQPSGSYKITYEIKSPTTGSVDTIVDEIVVNRVRKITLLPPHSGQIFAGGIITYVHTLTNNGNDPEPVVNLTTLEGIATWNTVLYLDNGSIPGELDDTDTPITSVTDLAAGQTVTIIAKISSPAGSAPGTVNPTTITATAPISGSLPAVTSVVTDNTTVVSSDIKIDKLQRNDTTPTTFSASQVTANPGDLITYKLIVENTGSSPAEQVIIYDTVPAYTTYVTNSATVVAGETTTTATVTATRVDATNSVEFKLDPSTAKLQPGEKIVVTFQVRIDG